MCGNDITKSVFYHVYGTNIQLKREHKIKVDVNILVELGLCFIRKNFWLEKECGIKGGG